MTRSWSFAIRSLILRPRFRQLQTCLLCLWQYLTVVSLRKAVLQSPSFQWILCLAEDILILRTCRLLFHLHLVGCCYVGLQAWRILSCSWMLHIPYKFFQQKLRVSRCSVWKLRSKRPIAVSLPLLYTGRAPTREKSRLISLCDAVCTTDLRWSMIRSESHWFILRLFSRVMVFGLARPNHLPFSACRLLVDKALVQNCVFWEKVSGWSHELV